MDWTFTDEQTMLREMVKKFATNEIKPIASRIDEEEKIPRELIDKIAELGLLGCALDGYGCAGLDNVSYGLICQELERGDSGLRSFVSVQGSLCMFPIHAYGSEEQKQRWLPQMAAGKAIGCFVLTEPYGGSDPGNKKTRAWKDGSDWIVSLELLPKPK